MPVEPELELVTESILNEIVPGQCRYDNFKFETYLDSALFEVSDDHIQALHRIFQQTFIAALDLIDRACGM